MPSRCFKTALRKIFCRNAILKQHYGKIFCRNAVLKQRYGKILRRVTQIFCVTLFQTECLRWLGILLQSDIWAVYGGILFRMQYRARLSYLPASEAASGGSSEGKDVVMPKLGQPLPDGWVSFEEEFIVFWICNTRHAAYNVLTCPNAKMNDGLFHMLIVW